MGGASTSLATAPTGAGPHHPWLARLLLAAVTLAAYWVSFRAPFFFDDFRCVVENSSIRDLGNIRAVLAPEPHTMLASRPLANLSFALNVALFGQSLAAYHAVNLAFHLAAALLFLGLVRRTIGAPVALPVAVVWAAHPLLVPAVSYISQRTEVLMGLCYLVTVYAFVRGAAGRRGWLALSAATCAVGMATKEVMVTAPLAVLLSDRTFFSGTFGAALRGRAAYYSALFASWLLLAVLMLRGLDPMVGLERGVGAWEYALVQCKALALYATRAVWPHPMAFDYGEFVSMSVLDAAQFVWAPALVVGGLVFACWRRNALGFWLGWIALTLGPTSSFVPITLQPIAENRAYLALAGALAAAAWMLRLALGTRLTLVFATAALPLAALTLHRNRVFADPTAPWAEAVRTNPNNARALNNLGVTLQMVGRPAEAEPLHRRAVELKPESADFQSSYSSALLALGRHDDALHRAREALRLAPNFATAHANLGAALLNQGRIEDGIASLRTALRYDSTLGHAHQNLALALTDLIRPSEALPHFEIAIAQQPFNAFLHRRHAQCLHAVGRPHNALTALRTSLQLQPAQPELHLLAGAIQFEQGRLSDALESMQAALAIKSDYIDARYNAAIILERVGRPADALREIETVLRLRPDHIAGVATRERLRITLATPR